MADSQPKTIRFTLVENAIDFLLSAVAYVKTKDEHERGFKYGILHLCDGIELLLKCRLNDEHWSLVLADVDRTALKDVEGGDFKSVAWQEAISRVEKCVGHDFKAEDKSLLEHLRKLRNRIQHFDVSISPNECNSLLAAGLHFATTFIEEELAATGLDDELQEMRTDLAEFTEFVSVRLNAIKPQLADATKYGIVVPCPRCRQDTLHADGDNAACLFCGYSDDGETVADEWVTEFGGPRRMKDEAAEPIIQQCPECAKTAMVPIALYLNDNYPRYFCFACGTHGEHEHCLICNGLFEPDDEETACMDCMRAQVEKDD